MKVYVSNKSIYVNNLAKKKKNLYPLGAFLGMLFITDIIYKLFVNDTGCQNVKSKAQKNM